MISFPFIFQASIGSATDKGYIVSILLLKLTWILFSSSVLFLLCFVRQSWIWLWFDLFECFVLNNQLWFVHIWNWAFMWKGNFLSCFKVLLSFCQVVPSSQPPPPLLQKISSQSNNSPDKFNIAPVNIADVRFFGHKENHLIKVNVLFVLFAVWYWKWWG